MITDNFLQTPEELIVELFNGENNLSLRADQFDIKDGHRDLLNKRREVNAILLDKTGFDCDVRDVVLTFTPIELEKQFSVIDLQLREVDVFDENKQIRVANILSEIERRYKIKTNETEFTIRHTEEGEWFFSVTELNRAWMGEVPINMELSLHTRITERELNGFEPKYLLSAVVKETEIKAFDRPVGELDLQRATWYRDFTAQKSLFTSVPNAPGLSPSWKEAIIGTAADGDTFPGNTPAGPFVDDMASSPAAAIVSNAQTMMPAIAPENGYMNGPVFHVRKRIYFDGSEHTFAHYIEDVGYMWIDNDRFILESETEARLKVTMEAGWYTVTISCKTLSAFGYIAGMFTRASDGMIVTEMDTSWRCQMGNGLTVHTEQPAISTNTSEENPTMADPIYVAHPIVPAIELQEGEGYLVDLGVKSELGSGARKMNINVDGDVKIYADGELFFAQPFAQPTFEVDIRDIPPSAHVFIEVYYAHQHKSIQFSVLNDDGEILKASVGGEYIRTVLVGHDAKQYIAEYLDETFENLAAINAVLSAQSIPQIAADATFSLALTSAVEGSNTNYTHVFRASTAPGDEKATHWLHYNG